ncbi:hypothetical protein YWY31_44940 [Paenibacillus illinoisensis]
MEGTELCADINILNLPYSKNNGGESIDYRITDRASAAEENAGIRFTGFI